MKGLSLTQPWATLVAIKAKRIETRSWSTNYRGVVAIHAAKGMPRQAQEICFDEPFFSSLEAAGDWVPDVELPAPRKPNLPFGTIIAVADLWDCRSIDACRRWVPTDERELAFGDYTEGRWMWFLCKIRQLSTQIPCRGALGLWSVSAEVILQINAQLGIDVEAGR